MAMQMRRVVVWIRRDRREVLVIGRTVGLCSGSKSGSDAAMGEYFGLPGYAMLVVES